MGGPEGGRGGNAERGHQLMRSMGKEISAAIQTFTLQRKVIEELLLSELRKPVGILRRDG